MLAMMTDIETLSVRSDAAVISIGAALFDEKEVLKTEGWVIDLAHIHGHISGGTLKWWMEQDAAAREFSMSGKLTNGMAAFNFKCFMNSQGEPTEFWANDPNFDYTILQSWWYRIHDDHKIYNNMHELAPGDWPISYKKMRSYRTIIAEAEALGWNQKDHWENFVMHNPIEDAANQARMVIHARSFLQGYRPVDSR